MLITLSLRDYMYLVCISVICRLLVTMGESPVVTDDCRIIRTFLDYNPNIKIIILIIPAAVRKGY